MNIIQLFHSRVPCKTSIHRPTLKEKETIQSLSFPTMSSHRLTWRLNLSTKRKNKCLKLNLRDQRRQRHHKIIWLFTDLTLNLALCAITAQWIARPTSQPYGWMNQESHSIFRKFLKKKSSELFTQWIAPRARNYTSLKRKSKRKSINP